VVVVVMVVEEEEEEGVMEGEQTPARYRVGTT